MVDGHKGTDSAVPLDAISRTGFSPDGVVELQRFRPVVKTMVPSPHKRVVAGSNPATGIRARVAQWVERLYLCR